MKSSDEDDQFVHAQMLHSATFNPDEDDKEDSYSQQKRI